MSLAVIDGKTIKDFVEDTKAFDACVNQYFNNFDVDGDKKLSKMELRNGLDKIVTFESGLSSQNEGIDNFEDVILKKFDEDKDGMLGLNEFGSLMKEIMLAIARGIGNSSVLVALDVHGLFLKAVQHETRSH